MAESRSDMASEKMKQFALFCILSPNVIAIRVIRLPSTENSSITRKISFFFLSIKDLNKKVNIETFFDIKCALNRIYLYPKN